MAFQRDGYWYDQQIKRWTTQFMAIFQGLQVQVGKWNTEDEQLITVPIHYGSPDRVVAALIANNTQNQPLRLPVMAAQIATINIAKDRMHGTGVQRREAYVPVGGLIPNDIRVIHQRMPVPYDLEMKLGICVSNTDQHLQIIEQILPLFDPQLQIQSSDAPFDLTRLTSVEITNGPVFEQNTLLTTDTRIIQSILSFKMPIWISIPADIRRDFIEKIYIRIGAVDAAATTNEEIILELDQQGIPYTLTQDGSNINVDAASFTTSSGQPLTTDQNQQLDADM
jgi:hypothetical protein